MTRPSPPSGLQVDGHAETGTAIVTKNTDGSLPVSAVIDDPDAGQKVRLFVKWSTDKNFGHGRQAASSFGGQGIRRSVTLTHLSKNTLYYGRAWTQDNHMTLSATYNSFLFWTDRFPGPPTLISPPDNVQVDPTVGTLFDWTAVDADETADPIPSTGFRVSWRLAGTPLTPPGPWQTYYAINVAGTSWMMPANTLKPSEAYEWHMKTRDPQGEWGEWSLLRSFTTIGVTKAPVPLSPGSEVSIYTDVPNTFKWKFQDPLLASVQGSADIQYRVVGTSTWFLVAGASVDDTAEYEFPEGTFTPGYRYEWQVKTTRADGENPESDWSPSAYFWTTLTPGSLAALSDLIGEGIIGRLGCLHNEIYFFERGGTQPVGELGKYTAVEWGRKRDDIAPATVTVDNYDSDQADLLGSLRSWRHEMVVIRDGERVFEGPIVHRQMRRGQVRVQARDVMVYVYRRLLRQGYNDSYRVAAGKQIGIKTVTERASLIVVNALGYADPNVLPYLTVVSTGTDAQESRVIPDYTKTAWEDLDDMASNAGLDYTTAGRRIILWDTHTPLGVLPEMRDGDFSEGLIVTEYGMQTANYFAVTDGNGAWGAAIPEGTTNDDWFSYYGPIEQLASGYGDTSVTAAVSGEMTPEQLTILQEQLRSQARRNINGRWPTPLVARVPDNSTIVPTANLTLSQLVPGVWIPLRVDDIVQPFAQMQKLDSVTVTEDRDGEKVAVVLSPAPLGSQDPDATGTETGGDE